MLHIADALCKVCAKSLKAVVEFVRRVSPATVGRSIDWDVIREDDATKMSEGRHRWTDLEVRVFLESCLEEIAAYNITSNTPKNKAWDNLQQKVYDKCRKVVNRGQLQYEWRECKKRFNDWVWLESQATGLGRDPHTSAIVANDSWWKSKNGLRKGVMAFRNDPLKHIDLHHAVFGGLTVVGNHFGVPGAAQATPQGAVQWQTIDVTQLIATYRPPAPSPAAPLTADRGKGKRPAAETSASGGSGKKSRSDSTGQALERLAALRMESMESRAREAAAAKAVGVEACLQLVENDGHRIGGPVWNWPMSSAAGGSNWTGQHSSSDEDDAIIDIFAATVDINERAARRIPVQTGISWMVETMANRNQCRAMLRLTAEQIHSLHDLLTTSYGLDGTAEVCALEKLGMFLYIMGGNRSNRNANNRWVRSSSTVSIYFNQVLLAMNDLAANILKPVDPNFTDPHPMLLNEDWFKPFYQSVGAVDGTHVSVVTSAATSIQHRNRHHVTTKNVLVICDHDGRIIFCDAGWPGSVHDQRILNEAVQYYPDNFPRVPLGRYILVDSGFSSRMGFLAPYPHVRYHRDQLGREGAPPPEGREETFNHRHSSLRGIVERTFGIVKKQWQILKEIPYY